MTRAAVNRIVLSSDDESQGTYELLSTVKHVPARQHVLRKRKANDPTEAATQPSSQSTKTASKRQKGTIHSFFNAATESQRLEQVPSADTSRSKQRTDGSVGQDDIFDISDDDTDAVMVTTTKGSSTQAAHRKRKLKHNDPSFEDMSVSSSGTKFKKSGVLPRLDPEATRPWTEQYPPTDLSELAVHKKKVAQVQSVLEESLSPRARPRLIVLKGPSGTGKTTTVKLLARSLGVNIREWENPVDVAGAGSTLSASARFEEFLSRGAKFATLEFAVDLDQDGLAATNFKVTSDEPAQVMLIEEFPSTLAASSTALQAFRSALQQYLSIRHSPELPCIPIIMVISETLLSSAVSATDSFTAHRLLGPAILTHPLTALVEFNDIAPTILIKALETVVLKEARKSGRRRTPGPQVLKEVAQIGDVRSAIAALEFLCLRGDADDDTWSAKIAFTKPKRANKSAPLTMTKKEQESLALIGNRGRTLDIFHAVGKVVYNKRHELASGQNAGAWRHGRPPETDPDSLLNELGTDVSVFVAALHENFALSCASVSRENSLNDLNSCLDVLSDADLMQCGRFNSTAMRGNSTSALDSQRQDDMSFHTAVRGLQAGLPFPVKRGEMPGQAQSVRNGAFKMFYPTSIKIWKKMQAMSDVLDLVIAQGSMQSSWTINARSEGVTSWKRSQAGPANGMSVIQPQAARLETLLERLPLAAHILACREAVDVRLRAQIMELTSFDGFGVKPDEDEEVEDDALAALDGRVMADNGSTSLRRNKPTMATKGDYKSQRPETEGAGLRIPVEHDVEKLVLSDDDIVDDFT